MEQQHLQPADTVLATLRTMAELASQEDHGSHFTGTAFNDGTSYGYFLGLEKTPENIIFGKAIVVSCILQFPIFYTVWYFCPSLTKNRKGLAWVLTLFCAIAVVLNTIPEQGYLRTSLWSLLGWEQQGPDAATATVFTYWMPALHKWVFQLGDNSLATRVTLSTLWSSLANAESFKRLMMTPQTYKDLAGEYLRWFITLPFFSLAPLKPTHVFSPTAPYYMGGGGRLLFSMEIFPRETWYSSVMGGYFIGYCIGDLVLGHLHYKEHVDPTSGWMHHFVYSWLVYQLAKKKMLSQFLIAGGLLEISTLFLASGNMFPERRGEFWFPFTFFTTRIVFVGFMLHECMFNFPTPTGGAAIYAIAFVMHVVWFGKYLRSRQRRMLRVKKEREAKLLGTSGAHGAKGVLSKEDSTVISSASSKGDGTFQLRVKKDK